MVVVVGGLRWERWKGVMYVEGCMYVQSRRVDESKYTRKEERERPSRSRAIDRVRLVMLKE